MKTHDILKSIRMIGIKKECLFKDFPTAIPDAKSKLYAAIPSNANDIELISYKMTEEEIHPDRAEIFYFGIMVGDSSVSHDELELIIIENQSFVITTHKGVISDIWKSYNEINEYMKENSLEEDKTSFVVELYDSRFNPGSDESEMEIYIPVKNKFRMER
ncbi:GyrI-like domain-containing protein [Cohnella lupini]|uniref:Putative transcriptional regulator YdeE n=1 Tax=Cohnella lupini TaxID=1294267 RepID=A0A3D9IWX9_9BACL|nr:GyrI-like domain-containing protein [Cohnella lupini]RED66318.1 putative transcriptional regulator YdeE [Cohnella lupini]